MTAIHHLFGMDDGLECVRADPHTAGHGCVFTASSCPQANDTEPGGH